MKQVAAIILAAGQSSRFRVGPENSKVLVSLNDRPLVRHVAEAALASRARPVFIVTGEAHQKIEAVLTGLNIRFLRNPNPAIGLSQSLKIGIKALADDVEGAIILLADMPYVTAEIIDELLGAFDTAPAGTKAVIPVHAGGRGNPVLLGKDIFGFVRDIEGDRGACSVLEAQDQGIFELPIDDPAIEIDIDTPEMLLRSRDSAQ